MTYLTELGEIVEARIGVRLHVRRVGDPVVRFVADRVKELGLAGPSDYVARIASARHDDHEFRLLVRIVTNGQTYFFRDMEQLDALADHLATVARARPVFAWCAACATGEEAYSLVIACLERRVDIRVIATDVNDERVERARNALYDDFAVRHVPPALLTRHFGREGRRFRVSETVRSRVEASTHNLLTQEPPAFAGRAWSFDAILCRNLFIYLARERVESIVAQMGTVLAPHGVLCLGTAESLHGHDVRLVATALGTRTAYRHELATGSTPRDSEPPRVRTTRPPAPALIEPAVSTNASTTKRAAPTNASSEVDRIVEAIHAGRLDDARSRLASLDTRAVPWDVRVSLANAHLRAHDFESAVECYRAAMRQAPLEPEPAFFLGLAELKLGRHESARDTLRRVVFLEPAYWRASLLLAGLFERSGNASAAARELTHARERIESSVPHPEYRSLVEGIPAATVSSDDARRTIELRLAALGRADRGGQA